MPLERRKSFESPKEPQSLADVPGLPLLSYQPACDDRELSSEEALRLAFRTLVRYTKLRLSTLSRLLRYLLRHWKRLPSQDPHRPLKTRDLSQPPPYETHAVLEPPAANSSHTTPHHPAARDQRPISFLISKASPLSILLLPSSGCLSHPRYDITTSADSPSRNWTTTTIRRGRGMESEIVAEVVIKPSAGRGTVLFRGRLVALEEVMVRESGSCAFQSAVFGPSRYRWVRGPRDTQAICTLEPVEHRPSHAAIPVATLTCNHGHSSESATLAVHPDHVDSLDSIVLTAFIMENTWWKF